MGAQTPSASSCSARDAGAAPGYPRAIRDAGAVPGYPSAIRDAGSSPRQSQCNLQGAAPGEVHVAHIDVYPQYPYSNSQNSA